MNVYNETKSIRYDARTIKGIEKGLGFYTKQLLGLTEENEKSCE